MNDILLMAIMNSFYYLSELVASIILRHSLDVYQVFWNGVLECNQGYSIGIQ